MRTHLAALLHVALFAALIPALTIPPPLPLLTLTNTTHPLTMLTTPGIGICPSPTTLTTLRPKYADCINAIRERLPSYPGRGTFHRDGAPDPFTLPVFVVWGTCQVTVVLGGRLGGAGERDSSVWRGEESSWLEIREKAEEVNEVCREGERSGGKIVAGQGGGVWVKLGRAGVGKGWDWEGEGGEGGFVRLGS